VDLLADGPDLDALVLLTITDEDTHLQSLVHLGSLLHIFVGPVR
jgi:hypothetical protein